MSGWKNRLAALLAPQMAENEKRYWNLRMNLDDAHRWLGEFPDIEAVCEWLNEMERGHFRSLDEAVQKAKWRSDISNFREQLRHRAKATS